MGTPVTDQPKVLIACPTWQGELYALKRWAEAYHAQTWENKAAYQVDNSNGPQHEGNRHYLHIIRGYDIPADWQHTRWPAFWDTLELSWQMIVEHAHEVGADFIFSVEADVIVPPDAMQKMVEAAYAHADGEKVAVVTQRYHPRGQGEGLETGQSFWWDTLGCSLFPVQPLWERRLLVKSIFEIQIFIDCQRAGHPRYRPGLDGPDLFIPEHMKDPDDQYPCDVGASQASQVYRHRVATATRKLQGLPEMPMWQTPPEEVDAAAAAPVCESGSPCSLPPAVATRCEFSHGEEKRGLPMHGAPAELNKETVDWDAKFAAYRELYESAPPEYQATMTAPPNREPVAHEEVAQAALASRSTEAMPICNIQTVEEQKRIVLGEERIRLNIGSDFSQVSGFISVDFNPDVSPDVVADAKDLPMFETDTVDEIYSSHCLEHLTAEDSRVALKEWLRVLKPGGMLTVSVPDLMGIWQLYKHRGTWGEYNMPVTETYVNATVFGASLLGEEIPEMKDMYGGPGHVHKQIFIEDMLLNRVIEAGFVWAHEVQACFLRSSAIGETMVQARKPKQGE